MTVLEERFYSTVISLCNKVCDRLANKIDWEQRRYEIARDIYTKYEVRDENSAKFAVIKADYLINELKKEK